MMEEKFLTVQEVAKDLGLAESTVRTTLSEGRLLFTMMYGRKLISRNDVDAYKQRTRPDGEKPRGRPRKRIVMSIQESEQALFRSASE